MIKSILAGKAIRYWRGSSRDTGRGFDTGKTPRGRYWQRIPILAGIAALLLAASLACSRPYGSAPAPISSPVPTATPRISKPVSSIIPALRWETVSAYQSLNVRAESSYRSEGLGVLYHGEKVRITGECRGVWAPTRFRGSPAWVNSRYVTGNVCEVSK